MATKKSAANGSTATTINIPLSDTTPQVDTTELSTLESHPQVAPVVSKAHELLTFAQNLQVTDEQSAAQAVEVLAAAKQAKNGMENARKMFVGPLDRHVKALNAWFKNKLSPVTEADAITRKKLGAYQDEKDRIAREEAERRQKEQAEAYRKQLADAKKHKAEPPPPPPVVQEEPAPSIANFSTHGMAKRRSLGWTFEIVDFSKVPDEWKKSVINEELVKEAIAAGAREIDGLKIYEKFTVAVY